VLDALSGVEAVLLSDKGFSMQRVHFHLSVDVKQCDDPSPDSRSNFRGNMRAVLPAYRALVDMLPVFSSCRLF